MTEKNRPRPKSKQSSPAVPRQQPISPRARAEIENITNYLERRIGNAAFPNAEMKEILRGVSVWVRKQIRREPSQTGDTRFAMADLDRGMSREDLCAKHIPGLSTMPPDRAQTACERLFGRINSMRSYDKKRQRQLATVAAEKQSSNTAVSGKKEKHGKPSLKWRKRRRKRLPEDR